MKNIWMKAVFNSFTHWVAFGIVASFIPFVVFVELTNESIFEGTFRIITEATLEGDIALLMIPIVGGLIGETVIRSFHIKSMEIFSAIVGLCLFALLINYADEFRSIETSKLTDIKKERIFDSTIGLFSFMIIYALSVMASSSMEKT